MGANIPLHSFLSPAEIFSTPGEEGGGGEGGVTNGLSARLRLFRRQLGGRRRRRRGGGGGGKEEAGKRRTDSQNKMGNGDVFPRTLGQEKETQNFNSTLAERRRDLETRDMQIWGMHHSHVPSGRPCTTTAKKSFPLLFVAVAGPEGKTD